MFFSWSSTQRILFLETCRLNWLVAIATETETMRKTYKHQLLRSYVKDKELFIALACTNILFLLLMNFGSYGNLKIP